MLGLPEVVYELLEMLTRCGTTDGVLFFATQSLCILETGPLFSFWEMNLFPTHSPLGFNRLGSPSSQFQKCACLPGLINPSHCD